MVWPSNLQYQEMWLRTHSMSNKKCGWFGGYDGYQYDTRSMTIRSVGGLEGMTVNNMTLGL